MNENFTKLQNKINDSKNILITISKPDGDSIASALALYNAYSQEKNIRVQSSFFIPEYLKSLPLTDKFIIADVGQEDFTKYDAVIMVDAGEMHRVVETNKYPDGYKFPDGTFVICFDHHNSHDFSFAEIDLFDGDTTSTCEIIYDYLISQNINLDATTATLLFSGMFTDSLNFTLPTAKGKSFRKAGELLDLGGDKTVILNCLNARKSIQAIKATGVAINNMQIVREESFSYVETYLEEEDIKYLTENDLSDFISLVKNTPGFIQIIKDTDFGYVAYQKGDFVKVSFRSKTFKYNLAKICEKFDGGGHPSAAAFEIKGNLFDVMKELKEILKEELPKQIA